MPVRLPSLKALRAFETVARHLSFKKAGAELNVTPAAVSHLVKILEEDLGVQLFIRNRNYLKLTKAGQDIYPDIEQGFKQIGQGVRKLDRHYRKAVLKIAVAPAFSTKWLVPHLDSFFCKYPGLDINIHASHDVIDYASEEVDIGIRFGAGQYAGFISELLLADALIPVARPDFVKAHNITTPDDFSNHMLLHDESMRFNENFPDWSAWFSMIGIHCAEAREGPRFSTASDAIEAAISGAGILLTRETLVCHDIAAGKLVRLSGSKLPLRQGFYIVYAEENIKREEVLAFRNWLVQDLVQART
ncbi:MAG: transcriptional regulator GcvA [Methyloligellaceae bacterium]